MAAVQTRNSEDDEWRVACPLWQNIHSDRAEEIARQYNKNQDKQYKANKQEWEK